MIRLLWTLKPRREGSICFPFFVFFFAPLPPGPPSADSKVSYCNGGFFDFSASLNEGPEADHFGDLMRIWVRAGTRLFHASGFSRAVGDASDPTQVRGSTSPRPYLRIMRFHGRRGLLRRKENSSRGLPPASPDWFTSPFIICLPVAES